MDTLSQLCLRTTRGAESIEPNLLVLAGIHEETKAKQSGNDNNEITQVASKVGNDGGEATDSEENSDKGGTSSPKKEKET